MKYCSYCGKELMDEDVFCSACGSKVEKRTKCKANRVFKLIAKIAAGVSCGLWAMILSVFSLEFTLIGLVEGENVWLLVGLLLLIPLVWKIPLMISVYKKFKYYEYMSKVYKICVLIFLSIPAGIMLLLMKDE